MNHHQVTVLFHGMFLATQTDQGLKVYRVKAMDHNYFVSVSKIDDGVITALPYLIDLKEDVSIDLVPSNTIATSKNGDSTDENYSYLIDFAGLNNIKNLNMRHLGPEFCITTGTLYTADLLEGTYQLYDSNSHQHKPLDKVGATIGVDIQMVIPVDPHTPTKPPVVRISQKGLRPIDLCVGDGKTRYEILASNVRGKPGKLGGGYSDFHMYYKALNVEHGDKRRWDLQRMDDERKEFVRADGYPVACSGSLCSNC